MHEEGIVDVLIVGAGPTGSALAIDLVRRGHSVRIVDKERAGFDGSRAKGIQPRTQEVFADLGVLDAVHAGGNTYPPMGIHLGPLTVPIRMSRLVAASSSVPFPNTWLIPQSRTNAALHARLDELGVVIDTGTAVRAVTQHDDHVVVDLEGDGRMSSVTARYVIGADGGASTVRKSQDIAFEGSTDDADRMIIADIHTTGLSRNRWHIWPGVGGRFTGACPLPHSELFQWMIRLRADDDAILDHRHVIGLIRERVHSRTLTLGDISWVSLFRPNVRLAARYRERRVFLAGDAAHVHTPAGAQGLNTGVQDAYNLGWKLSQVLHGAPDALLDTYNDERRPIAAGVLGLSNKKYEGMGKLDPSSIRRGDDEKQLTLTYRGGPLSVPTASTSALQAGDRAPDAWVRTDSGARVRLHSLIRGGDFTVLTYGPSAVGDTQHVRWPARGAALHVLAIDPGDALIGPATTTASDAGRTVRRAYGISTDTTIVIRPDGYIAAISTSDPAAAIGRIRALSAPIDTTV